MNSNQIAMDVHVVNSFGLHEDVYRKSWNMNKKCMQTASVDEIYFIPCYKLTADYQVDSFFSYPVVYIF